MARNIQLEFWSKLDNHLSQDIKPSYPLVHLALMNGGEPSCRCIDFINQLLKKVLKTDAVEYFLSKKNPFSVEVQRFVAALLETSIYTATGNLKNTGLLDNSSKQKPFKLTLEDYRNYRNSSDKFNWVIDLCESREISETTFYKRLEWLEKRFPDATRAFTPSK